MNSKTNEDSHNVDHLISFRVIGSNTGDKQGDVYKERSRSERAKEVKQRSFIKDAGHSWQTSNKIQIDSMNNKVISVHKFEIAEDAELAIDGPIIDNSLAP